MLVGFCARSSLRVFTLLSVGVLAGCAARTIVVQAPNAGDPVRGLVASGNGEAKAAPDIARTTIGVETRAATAEEATAQTTARMTAVLLALKSAGVAPSDLRTQNFSVSFEQEPTAPSPTDTAGTGKATLPRGFYRASNMVEVTVRDLGKVGQLLKLATDAGANNIWGISFELEHPEALLALARAQAIEHAKSNAAELARLAGVKLGAIVSITENGGGGQPMPMMKAMAASGPSQDVPVERGEVNASLEVQLVYALPE